MTRTPPQRPRASSARRCWSQLVTATTAASQAVPASSNRLGRPPSRPAPGIGGMRRSRELFAGRAAEASTRGQQRRSSPRACGISRGKCGPKTATARPGSPGPPGRRPATARPALGECARRSFLRYDPSSPNSPRPAASHMKTISEAMPWNISGRPGRRCPSSRARRPARCSPGTAWRSGRRGLLDGDLEAVLPAERRVAVERLTSERS